MLGVSGISSDMRMLLEREPTDARAADAIDLFDDRISREVGSLTSALGGLGALVFTGEHAAPILARVCRAANWLGMELDVANNLLGGPRVSLAVSKVTVWVIPTNEELMIARHTQQLLRDEQT